MPDMYPPGEYDLAGFAVGAVERSRLMPHVEEIEIGDVVIALPSTGVHSNGFSLVRKVMKLAGVGYRDVAPFSKENKSFGKFSSSRIKTNTLFFNNNHRFISKGR